MSYTITIKNNETHRTHTTTLDYSDFDVVYYVFKKRKKWVIRKSMIDAIVFTNIWQYKLDNGWHICSDEFSKLHKNKEAAIQQCIELNQKDLVKIYNKDSWRFVGGYKA